MSSSSSLPQALLHAQFLWEDKIKINDEELKKKPPTSIAKPPIRTPPSSSTKMIYYDDFGVVDRTKVLEAMEWKEKGNKLFGEAKWKDAVLAYSKSIELDPKQAIYWGNRALAYLRMNNYEETVKDCTRALELDETNVKCYARRATANKNLQHLEAAIVDLEKVISLEPKNKEATKELSELQDLASKKETITSSSSSSSPSPSSSSLASSSSTSTPSSLSSSSSSKPTTKPFSSLSDNELLTPISTLKVSSSSSPSPASSSTPSSSAITTHRPSPSPSPSSSKVKTTLPPARVFKLKPKVPTIPPTTAYEFESTWRELKSHPEEFKSYIRLIEPSSYSSLFKDAMTSSIFSSFLQVISALQQEGGERQNLVFEMMSGLSKVARVDVLVLLMSTEEKLKVEQIFNSCEGKEEAAVVAELKKVFNNSLG